MVIKQSLVERLHALCRGESIGLESLPGEIRGGSSLPGTPTEAGTLRDLERQRILQALVEARGNKKLAARRLGIHRSTLYAKLHRYEIDPEALAAGKDDAGSGFSSR